jgi:hypothetical protein
VFKYRHKCLILEHCDVTHDLSAAYKIFATFGCGKIAQNAITVDGTPRMQANKYLLIRHLAEVASTEEVAAFLPSRLAR